MIVAGCHPFGVARSQRHVGRDEHGGADPVRMPRGEGERPGTTLGRAQDRGALDAAGVQDLRGIFSEEQISVEIWIQGTVRTTVAQPVEHDHAIPGAKVSHLVAPEVAVDDRPGRQKQHRLVCVTELLPVDPPTITSDLIFCLRAPQRPQRPGRRCQSTFTSSQRFPNLATWR
jgi:hypothetical protein